MSLQNPPSPPMESDVPFEDNRLPGIAILLPPATAFGLALAKAASIDEWILARTSQFSNYWQPLWIVSAWGLLTLVCAFIVAREDKTSLRGFRAGVAYMVRFLGATMLHLLVSTVILAVSSPVLLIVALLVSLFR